MSNNPTDIWSWIAKDEERLVEEGGIKQTLVEQYQRFWECFHSDNLTAELAINDALDAARAAGEMRWELHLRHWRLQLWLTQDRIKEMLPEAIDLLSLAIDERVKDVPQRICAYHDIVECYVQMDPAGYYQDIKENAEHILGQLPKKHPCADCARGNVARAAAAAGQTEEAQRWLDEHEANRHVAPYPGMLLGRALTKTWLKQWDEAERIYQEASKIARKEEDYPNYMEALIGVARARIGKGDLAGAQETILQVRRSMKYEGETNLLAFLLEVEGYLAESHNVPQAASGYLTHSARLQYELGRYRDAAEIALHSVEMSDKAGVPVADREETLTIAANAVGMLPTTSANLYQRLAALGRVPATQKPAQEEEQTMPVSTEQRRDTESNKERLSIETVLQAHMHSGNLHGITTMLFRLGIWYDRQKQARAAVDYFIWSAALERLGKFEMREHQGTIKVLKQIGKRLPNGAIIGALHAAESAPPAQLLPLLKNLTAEQWRWTIQAIENEFEDRPVVEPEPLSTKNQEQFQNWLNHCASMLALIVRFRDQANPTRCEAWAGSVDESAQEMEERIGERRAEPGAMALPTFVRNLAALSRGADIEEIRQNTPQPFDQVIKQIEALAKMPVWQHPESSPLDYLVEQAVQKAVRALRQHDDHRSSRLANLTFRYELMAIDLLQHKQLQSMARFLEALGALVLNEGTQLPASEPPLEAPYAAILAAVLESGRTETTGED